MLPPEGFSLRLTSPHTPFPPQGTSGSSQNFPKKKNPFPSPAHSQRCSPPAQDEVWRVQKKGAGTKYSWGEQRFIFHPFPRQQTLHSPCLLPVSPLPRLLLAPPLLVFAETEGAGAALQPRALCQGVEVPPNPVPTTAWAWLCGAAVPQLPQELTPGCGTAGVPCRVTSACAGSSCGTKGQPLPKVTPVTPRYLEKESPSLEQRAADPCWLHQGTALAAAQPALLTPGLLLVLLLLLLLGSPAGFPGVLGPLAGGLSSVTVRG